ncbi:MAG: diguanylate cyclase [Candidatus Omnitrophica bacterium]|nr:diguanylate cyclase [Candidatus Omnitrophota bacterium]
MDKTLKILVVTDDRDLRQVLKFSFEGWGYEVFFDEKPHPDLQRVIRMSPDVVVVDVHSGDPERLEICELLKKDFATVYIPVITLINKKHLRQNLLDLRHGVDDYLVNPPDPLELRIRIEMAIKRSKQSFYANPLTGLPGGVVIEEALNERLVSGEPFVAGHIDIDNFKAFNDVYGYLKGDRIIMQLAYMLTSCVRNWGNSSDFVGHIGGDDFVMITTPERYNSICQSFICMFDTITPFHYSPEDRERGYVMAKCRTKRLKKVPLMSVTIALFIRNIDEEVHNILELNDKIAEVKKYLKRIPGSKYMADRRIKQKDDHLTVQVFSNDESLIESYKPLGQILLESKVINRDQLDEALKAHWKKGTRLGEILRDMGYLTEDVLSEALVCQQRGLADEEKREGSETVDS